MKTNSVPLLLFLVVALIGVASTTHAQTPSRNTSRGDSHNPSPATITFYAYPNFQGDSITLTAGEDLDDLNHVRFPNGRSVNNRVSSIRIEGRAEVTLFNYRGFEGETITLRDSAPRLDRIPQGLHQDWDNALSSVVVRNVPRRPTERSRGKPNHHAEAPTPKSYPKPPHYGTPRDLAHDNREVHVKFDRGTVRVVERAYQDILGRNPDQAGLSNYVRIMQTRGWSDTRLRRELRKSSEYRSSVVPRIVKAAYRDILNREPDQAGFRFYTDRMVQAGWTQTRVRDALKRSPEYVAQLQTNAWGKGAKIIRGHKVTG